MKKEFKTLNEQIEILQNKYVIGLKVHLLQHQMILRELAYIPHHLLEELGAD